MVQTHADIPELSLYPVEHATGGHSQVITSIISSCLCALHHQILDEIAEHGIRIYQLPDADSDEDEEFKEQTRVLKVGDTADADSKHVFHPLFHTSSKISLFLFQASIPFAVIGSNQLIEVKGKKIRGRLYPWGVVEVENPEHNDFLKLRTMLV